MLLSALPFFPNRPYIWMLLLLLYNNMPAMRGLYYACTLTTACMRVYASIFNASHWTSCPWPYGHTHTTRLSPYALPINCIRNQNPCFWSVSLLCSKQAGNQASTPTHTPIQQRCIYHTTQCEALNIATYSPIRAYNRKPYYPWLSATLCVCKKGDMLC